MPSESHSSHPTSGASRRGPILIASDHAAVEMKSQIQRLLPEYEWQDLGPVNTNRVDYPDYAERLSQKIAEGDALFGVLLCGSGVGMCIAANKIGGIRAVLADNPVIARLSREHNDANVLCLGARFLAPEYAAEIVRAWLETPFSDDPRHHKRVDKIKAIEEKHKKTG